VDISELIITNSISKPIESYADNITHIQVAKKLKQRVPENPPRMGDRIRYTLIKLGDKKTKIFECAECPDHVVANNLQIDYEKIYRKKVFPSIERILYIIFNHQVLQGKDQNAIRINRILKQNENSKIIKEKEKKKCKERIMEEVFTLSKPNVEKILNVFKVKKGYFVSTINPTGLLKFGFKVIKCMICDKGHNNKISNYCLDCANRGAETMKTLFMDQYKMVEKNIEEMKKTCSDCQKQFEIKQECGNYDCNHGIYYKRITMGNQFKDLQNRKLILDF
jgi:hypothetical protein